jgi:hypothetical protein
MQEYQEDQEDRARNAREGQARARRTISLDSSAMQ